MNACQRPVVLQTNVAHCAITTVITTRGSILQRCMVIDTHTHTNTRLEYVSGVVVHLYIKPMFHLPPVPGVVNAVPPTYSALRSITPSLFNNTAQDEHIENKIL